MKANKLHQMVARLSGKLSCQEVNEFLAAYVDGQLDEPINAKFESHINRCINCRRYLEQYRFAIQLAQEDPIRPIPPDLVESTLAFLRQNT